MNKFNNVKFKPAFILSNPEKFLKDNDIQHTGSINSVLSLMKRDGAKCDCCNKEMFFSVVESEGKKWLHGMVEGSRITLDHNMLKSLEGGDTVDNLHLLCNSCNQLRGNHFAEYNEFKEWFKSTPNPSVKTLPPTRNYCILDFDKMLTYRTTDLDIGSTAVQENLKKEIFKQYYLTGKVNSAYANNISLYKKLSVNAWNELLNDLLVDVIKTRFNYKLPLERHVFINKKDFNKKPLSFSIRVNDVFNQKYVSTKAKVKTHLREIKNEISVETNVTAVTKKSTAFDFMKSMFSKLFKKGTTNVSTAKV